MISNKQFWKHYLGAKFKYCKLILLLRCSKRPCGFTLSSQIPESEIIQNLPFWCTLEPTLTQIPQWKIIETVPCVLTRPLATRPIFPSTSLSVFFPLYLSVSVEAWPRQPDKLLISRHVSQVIVTQLLLKKGWRNKAGEIVLGFPYFSQEGGWQCSFKYITSAKGTLN